ncbi:hypothetical protein [Kaarinaea lacus]
MKIGIEFSKVVPASKMFGETEEDTKQIYYSLEESKRYLNGFTWHDGFKNSYYGIGVSGIFSIILFEIIPCRKKVDNYVWVVMGDLQPAYITCADAPNPVYKINSRRN